MEEQNNKSDSHNLPSAVTEFIRLVVTRMRYRKSVRDDVRAELIAHFEDALKDCTTDQQKSEKAKELLTDFGDVKLLAILLRRAKRRCRPFWRTAVARTLQTIGILILALVLYSIWFSAGKPTIRVDYVALLNQKARPKVADSDNAWTHLEKAATLYVEPGPEQIEQSPALKNPTSPEAADLSALAQAEQDIIAEHVRLNENAWSEYVAASSKAYCCREYGFGPNCPDQDRWIFNIILPHLREFKNLARVGVWRCRIDIAQGKTTQAIDDCLVVARNGKHLQDLATLVEQLVGLSLSAFAHAEIIRVLDSQELTAEQLAELQRQLIEIYPGGYPLMKVEFERLVFHDTVQRAFTDGGIGGGHLIPALWSQFSNDGMSTGDVSARMALMPVFAAASMAHARRDKTLAVGDRIYDNEIKRATMTPYDRRHANTPSSEEVLSSMSRYRFFLLHMLLPALDRASEIGFRGKATHQAALTILAAKRFKLEKGQLPDSLNELVSSGFLNELPGDPFSDGPPVYKRTGDDFILYSLGPDFEDNAGKPSTDSKGRPRKWCEDGDTVFWPVVKAQD